MNTVLSQYSVVSLAYRELIALFDIYASARFCC